MLSDVVTSLQASVYCGHSCLLLVRFAWLLSLYSFSFTSSPTLRINRCLTHTNHRPNPSFNSDPTVGCCQNPLSIRLSRLHSSFGSRLGRLTLIVRRSMDNEEQPYSPPGSNVAMPNARQLPALGQALYFLPIIIMAIIIFINFLHGDSFSNNLSSILVLFSDGAITLIMFHLSIQYIDNKASNRIMWFALLGGLLWAVAFGFVSLIVGELAHAVVTSITYSYLCLPQFRLATMFYLVPRIAMVLVPIQIVFTLYLRQKVVVHGSRV